jgi:hypothetical protein
MILDLFTRDRHERATGLPSTIALAAAGPGRWVVADEDRRVALVSDAEQGTERSASTQRKIVAFAAAPDGSSIAVGSARGKIEVLAGGDWSTVLDGQMHAGRILALAFDGSGAVVSIAADGTVRRVQP